MMASLILNPWKVSVCVQTYSAYIHASDDKNKALVLSVVSFVLLFWLAKIFHFSS
ncbi:hypothetical protein CPSG_05468 [Coccidioides posadasii str. Silveira]|uniref:Uncharacterized protein n=1 Tax=Coccidioides posadasii (strain RMSCC 757 / Silveira) TaxID=443226 RepID=E9D6F9_COCPS|nr:hypothetical protein CPSG_05468 [Coccidioides posadasii str. Silveira]